METHSLHPLFNSQTDDAPRVSLWDGPLRQGPYALRPVETGFAVQHLAGHVTGESGNVNFGGNIAVVNAQGAEYHIVIAEHGALDPEQLPGSIQTPGPGVQIAFLGG